MSETLKVFQKNPSKSKRRLLRLSEADEKQISELAKKYAGGNVSGWIRYAALHYRPTKKDLA